MRGRFSTVAVIAAGLLGVAACSGGGGSTPTPSPTPTPTPTPPPGPVSYDVEPCLVQVVRPGLTVAILYVPDTLKVDFSRPSRFPNGRHLRDPVIDFTLAMLFADLTRHPISVLHDIPLGPPQGDRAFRSVFPYLATPNGNPPITSGGAAPYDFRTDDASLYTRVDRMGMPAVATALISGNDDKNAYNDDSPSVDSEFKWVPEIQSSLKSLTDALAEDFEERGITLCARPEE